MNSLNKLITATLVVLSANVFASACPQLYYSEIANVQSSNTIEICNSFFATNVSKTKRAVVFTSERIDPSKPFDVKRSNVLG